MTIHQILGWLRGESSGVQQSFLGARQNRAAAALAGAALDEVDSVQLSILGALGAVAAAGALAAASHWRWVALIVPLGMAINWFGLSVDLPLARRRRGSETAAEGMAHHLCESFSFLTLILAYGCSPFLTFRSAAVILFCYLLFSSYVYIRAAARRAEQMAFIGIGVTEFRILLAIWPLFAIALDLPASRAEAFPAIDIAVMALGAVAVWGFLIKLAFDGRKLAATAKSESRPSFPAADRLNDS
jgi:hypothetical protein